MNWYVVHTKPRQEQRALDNLSRQGYECFLPTLAFERIVNGKLAFVPEAMFPRYLFVNLEDPETGKGLSPIRSTKGVSQLVTFGAEPARVGADIIESLRNMSAAPPQNMFTPGQRVVVTDGPFSGMEGIYQTLTTMKDGESRALVLIELLHKPATLSARLASVKKID
jgi:transcriptional antiterminator RfaH